MFQVASVKVLCEYQLYDSISGDNLLTCQSRFAKCFDKQQTVI